MYFSCCLGVTDPGRTVLLLILPDLSTVLVRVYSYQLQIMKDSRQQSKNPKYPPQMIDRTVRGFVCPLQTVVDSSWHITVVILWCRPHQCLYPMTIQFLDYCTQILIITHNWYVHFFFFALELNIFPLVLFAFSWRHMDLTPLNKFTRPRYFVSLSGIRPNNYCVISKFDTENIRWIHPNEE